jgi:hypothetical protein
LRVSLAFSLKLFVLLIKYKPELHLYFIYVPVKNELSPQEGNLSFGFEMSQDSVCEMVLSTELVEYGGRSLAYDGSMGKVSSRLGIDRYRPYGIMNLENGFIA